MNRYITTIATVVLFVASGCIGPLVHIEKVDSAVTQSIKVYYDGEILKQSNVKIIGPVQATSCQNLITDSKASMTDCVEQMKMVVSRLGGNALLIGGSASTSANFLPGSKGVGTGINRNCWTSVDCSGIALIVSSPSK